MAFLLVCLVCTWCTQMLQYSITGNTWFVFILYTSILYRNRLIKWGRSWKMWKVQQLCPASSYNKLINLCIVEILRYHVYATWHELLTLANIIKVKNHKLYGNFIFKGSCLLNSLRMVNHVIILIQPFKIQIIDRFYLQLKHLYKLLKLTNTENIQIKVSFYKQFIYFADEI
jgi:hypothetical protein